MKLLQYWNQRVAELHNVTWPTNKQARHSMVVVLSVMLVVGFILTGMDLAFNELILWVSSLKQV